MRFALVPFSTLVVPIIFLGTCSPAELGSVPSTCPSHLRQMERLRLHPPSVVEVQAAPDVLRAASLPGPLLLGEVGPRLDVPTFLDRWIRASAATGRPAKDQNGPADYWTMKKIEILFVLIVWAYYVSVAMTASHL